MEIGEAAGEDGEVEEVEEVEEGMDKEDGDKEPFRSGFEGKEVRDGEGLGRLGGAKKRAEEVSLFSS